MSAVMMFSAFRMTAAAALAAFSGSATAGSVAWRRIGLDEISLGGEIGRRIAVTCSNNISRIDCEKTFLRYFREKKSSGTYRGMGKHLDAVAALAKHTGNPELIALKNEIVDAVVGCQLPDGYIGALKPEARMWGYWDLHECAYLIVGLVRNYRLFGDARSLEAARRAADRILCGWKNKPADWERRNIPHEMAELGLSEGFLNLYEATGDFRYIKFLVDERGWADYRQPIVFERGPGIKGHVYMYLHNCVSQLRLGRVLGRPLRHNAEQAHEFMHDRHGTTIAGLCGVCECWTDSQFGGHGCGETCATVYQLRFFDELQREELNARYGDACERMIYNGLFAAQEPSGRRIRYYTAFEGDRRYYPHDTFCCPPNYRRAIAELPAYIYYVGPNAVSVNHYVESRASFKMSDGTALVVRQETGYPCDGKVRIAIDPGKAHEWTLCLRIPAWAEDPRTMVNGEPVAVRSGTLAKIHRRWQAGDVVTLDFPMRVKLIRGIQQQAGMTALKRGPVVYALNPEYNLRDETAWRIFSRTGADASSGGGSDMTRTLQGVANAVPASPDKGRIAARRSALKSVFGKPPYGRAMIQNGQLDHRAFTLVPDDSVRPGGTALLGRITTSPMEICPTDANTQWVLFTEFTDPDAKLAYFRISDTTAAVEDEVFK